MNNQNPKKEVLISIRFDKQTYDVLKLIASHENISLSKVIREMTVAYMVNTGQHDDLLASIDPNDQNKAQKTL